jgi:hypothetical protein
MINSHLKPNKTVRLLSMRYLSQRFVWHLLLLYHNEDGIIKKLRINKKEW